MQPQTRAGILRRDTGILPLFASHKNVFFYSPPLASLRQRKPRELSPRITLCFGILLSRRNIGGWTYFYSGEAFGSNGCASVGLNVFFQQAEPQVHLLLTGTVDDDGIQADTCRGAKIACLIIIESELPISCEAGESLIVSSFPENNKHLHMFVMVNRMQDLRRPMFFSSHYVYVTLLRCCPRGAQPGMKSTGISLHLSVPHIPQINNNDVPFCFSKGFGLNFRESKAR